MHPPSQESIVSFFDGFCKNAYLVEVADKGGRTRHPAIANEVYALNAHRFFKRLNDFWLHELDPADMMEISLEFAFCKKSEAFLTMWWTICGLSSKQFQSVAPNDAFLRPISDESVISYYIGLSWFLHINTERREERIINFLKTVRDNWPLKLENERIYELWNHYVTDAKIQEWKEIGFDMLNIRHCVRGSIDQEETSTA